MRLVVPVFGLFLSLVGCGTEAESPQTTSETHVSMFTGRLDTADSVVGLAMSEQGDVYAYVCGGDTTFATHSRWFAGTFASNTASIENDGFRLDLTLDKETTDITLTAPDGSVHSTKAARAGVGNHSAVYESSSTAECPWGVVVLDKNGSEPDVFGTWCGKVASTKVYAQVTPVKPIDFSKKILPVLVNTPAGEEHFEVHQAGAIPANLNTP